MTSTSVYKGSFGEKPSSRVLRPPGGGSSNIFGTDDENRGADKSNASAKEATSCPQTSQSKQDLDGLVTSSSEKGKCEHDVTLDQEVKQSTSFRNKSSGFNPITGECYDQVKAEPVTAEMKQSTSVVVRQPPGGASSGLW